MLNIPTFAKDDLWEDDCASDEEEDDRASSDVFCASLCHIDNQL